MEDHLQCPLMPLIVTSLQERQYKQVNRERYDEIKATSLMGVNEQG